MEVKEGLAPNTVLDNTGAFSNAMTEGILDDGILDAITPRLTILDDQMEDVKPTFCTRCRTISASFLSTSYGHDSISISSYDRNNPSMDAAHICPNGTIALPDDDDDDVPLLRVSLVFLLWTVMGLV